MATPNYGFEKRQKELAKKRKKEDKLKAKADRKLGLLPEDDQPLDASDSADPSSNIPLSDGAGTTDPRPA